MSDFSTFGLGPSVQRGIAAAGFVEPRPIQTETIPAALEGRDILGLAQTGTGKTAAFALPILERLLATRLPETRHSGPRVLIVAPTRELASQISEEIRTLATFTRIRVATVFGGVSAHRQILALREKPEIVVACRGRLLDLMQQQVVRLDRVETLVLDEADHMFDMGFLPDIRRILAALPTKRQNLLFSATMPREIRGLADGLLSNPTVVELGHSRPVSTVAHAVYPVADKQKLRLLERLLATEKIVSAIVFTRTKHRAKRLALQLGKSGHRVVALQGNMSQNQRERAMEGFRKHDFDILVATDIAARGIDVQRVSHVVNFDMPNTTDAYTHRIGRTGRAERDGQAYTFVTQDDRGLVRAVERVLGQPIPRRTVEGIDTARPPAGWTDLDQRRTMPRRQRSRT
ncbi:MAG: DEAD/DEAH box helicase [Vicinamibacterales bacterium]|jgi:ATP-dependent RNA helicase RhlE|nr:DEAD/DEAH box helicase [Vicinamibacterales bacterium]